MRTDMMKRQKESVQVGELNKAVMVTGVAMGLALGAGVGLMLGVGVALAPGELALGMGVGILLGVGLGAALSRRPGVDG
jgi:hypothetical protein